MKRRLILLPVVFLILVMALAATLVVAPQHVQQAWTKLGLPAAGFDRLAGLMPAGAGLPTTGQQPPVGGQTAVVASGAIEAKETSLASEITGQVAEVLVDEGEPVTAGQVVVRLDDSLLQAQIQEAHQAVETARAHLRAAEAGPRPAQIAAAEAAVRQAEAARAGAQQAVADAKRARDNQQELDAQIHAVQARVDLAQRQIEQAKARQATIRVLSESIAGAGSDQGKTQLAVYQKQMAAADETIAGANAEAQGAQRLLSYLQGMRKNPVQLDVAVRAAEGQARLAEEAAKVAEAGLALAKAGPRPEAIALAQAQLAQAQAARRLLDVQLDKYAIVSPLDGVVTTRVADPGETATPGAPLLSIADLTQVTLVIYVPEPRLGDVQLGQPAKVQVDAYPGRTFTGVVSYISPRAEFTPKNIQTVEDRVQTVFAVKITLDNPEGALKAGMPADATLVVQ